MVVQGFATEAQRRRHPCCAYSLPPLVEPFFKRRDPDTLGLRIARSRQAPSASEIVASLVHQRGLREFGVKVVDFFYDPSDLPAEPGNNSPFGERSSQTSVISQYPPESVGGLDSGIISSIELLSASGQLAITHQVVILP